MSISNFTSIPEGYRPETLQPDHIPQMVELINHVTADYDPDSQRSMTVEELEHQFQTPGIDLESGTFNVFSGQHLVLSAVAFSMPPYVEANLRFFVHPAHRQPELTEAVYSRCEKHVRSFVALADPEQRVIWSTGTDGKETWLREFLKSHGFGIARAFWRMRIDMDEQPPAPNFDGLQLRPFDPDQHMRPVYDAIGDAFKDHHGYRESEDEDADFERWRHNMTSSERFDPSLWFVLVDGAEIAGAALGRPEATSHPEAGYIDILGVRPQWRRRGLGKALLLHSFNEFWKRGKRSVTLGVDADSLTGATRLYEKAGMYRDSEWFIYEKELRPGTDPIRR
jgi:mycothiol synthase